MSQTEEEEEEAVEDPLVSAQASLTFCWQMLEEDGRHGVSGWVSSWLGGRGAQSVPNTPQRPNSGHALNSVRNTAASWLFFPVLFERGKVRGHVLTHGSEAQSLLVEQEATPELETRTPPTLSFCHLASCSPSLRCL